MSLGNKKRINENQFSGGCEKPSTLYILVTGGAGFIGTNFIRKALSVRPQWHIVNLDALTYAGNLLNLSDLPEDQGIRYDFVRGDITDSSFIDNLFRDYAFYAVFHFAAESHVDRSILGPKAFLKTNVEGTFNLLQGCLDYWMDRGKPEYFRFIHVSTDEVYGSLGPDGYFTENTPYDPSSPYSASKAASDHFVKAYCRTYGLPVIITNCSNNYGPYQFPEKLIPLIILNIIENKPLPVYGDGQNIRDWLYVVDHCDALIKVFEKGRPGENYNIGGNSEYRNIDIVHMLCDLVDAKLKRKDSSRKLIRFVTDRPGHDRRYAIDASKIRSEIDWRPDHIFKQALENTVEWYLQNMEWVDSIRSGDYLKWIEKNYEKRSGDRA
jgi:dTDP-glucose 4,6-dehydratase